MTLQVSFLSICVTFHCNTNYVTHINTGSRKNILTVINNLMAIYGMQVKKLTIYG